MYEKDKIVISLCEQSGNMVRPWANAGYECFAVDLKNDDVTVSVGDGVIHYECANIKEWTPPEKPAKIAFAFPPCTDLAVSGARWFKQKGLHALADAIELVAFCQETMEHLDCPWMLENPVSTLSTHWREPDYKFDPYEYDSYTPEDERYTKETWLWTGNGFKMPKTNGVNREQSDDRIHKMSPSEQRKEKRAKTPTGFAKAVYLAHVQSDEFARKTTKTTQQSLNKECYQTEIKQ
jgi:hypothetical protein